VMSYFGSVDWIFVIYFVIFELKVFVYTFINHDNDDGADRNLPKTVLVMPETIREYFLRGKTHPKVVEFHS